MSLQASMVREGNWLFRHRSYLPTPIYLAGAALVVLGALSEPPTGDWRGEAWDLVCLAVAGLGVAIRIWIASTVPDKTSGRNVNFQVAESLNVHGLYSLVRHPLYVGNFFIYLAFALFPGEWWFVLFFVLVFWLYYERIMIAEEDFLARRFGEEFRAWAGRTPAFIPRFSLWQGWQGSHSLRTVFTRERSTWLGVGVGFGLYQVAEHATTGTFFPMDYLWIALAAAAILNYALCKLLLRAAPSGDPA